MIELDSGLTVLCISQLRTDFKVRTAH